MRTIILVLLATLTPVQLTYAGQRCNLINYSLSRNGEFNLPAACDGSIGVNFDSLYDLKKLQIIDPIIHTKLINLINELSIEKTATHKELITKTGAQHIEINDLTLYTSYPPIKKYRFSIGRYSFKGSVKLNSNVKLIK